MCRTGLRSGKAFLRVVNVGIAEGFPWSQSAMLSLAVLGARTAPKVTSRFMLRGQEAGKLDPGEVTLSKGLCFRLF